MKSVGGPIIGNWKKWSITSTVSKPDAVGLARLRRDGVEELGGAHAGVGEVGDLVAADRHLDIPAR
jgi:hypothetical protein